MRPITGIALAVGLAFSAPGYAQEPAGSAACDALPTAAQSGCFERLADAADAKLNDVYRRAVQAIGKSDSGDIAAWKAELKKAQQAWIAFRDADLRRAHGL